MSTQRIVRPKYPEIQLILESRVDVKVVHLAEPPRVRDQEVAAISQSHVDVIVEKAKGHDVFETNLHRSILLEFDVVASREQRVAEVSCRSSIQHFCQNVFLSFSRFYAARTSWVVGVRVVVTRRVQSFLYHCFITCLDNYLVMKSEKISIRENFHFFLCCTQSAKC